MKGYKLKFNSKICYNAFKQNIFYQPFFASQCFEFLENRNFSKSEKVSPNRFRTLIHVVHQISQGKHYFVRNEKVTKKR